MVDTLGGILEILDRIQGFHNRQALEVEVLLL